jgi:predicted DsbA family dithiol-disulfide isomerase
MSFKVYDYRCPECNVVEERFVHASKIEEQFHTCETQMKRLPCSPNLDYLGMGNDPDMATCWEKKGDMITKRHKDAGQAHHL